jgi:hypothetical protein
MTARLPSFGVRCILVGSVSLSTVGVSSFATAGSEGETATNIIAAQIRRQGHECKQPKNARHEEKESKPNETVWILECENATYRVTLVPDMAAHVEKID